MRQGIVLTLVLAFSGLVLAASAAGGSGTACPNGWEQLAVPQTRAELLLLPRIAAGLAADPAPYTVDDLVALGNSIDENGDGDFCLKDVSNLRGASVKIWGFFYLARDNNTSAG